MQAVHFVMSSGIFSGVVVNDVEISTVAVYVAVSIHWIEPNAPMQARGDPGVPRIFSGPPTQKQNNKASGEDIFTL